MMIQDACGFLSERRHRRDSQRQQSEAQLRTAAVKQREAFTRANVSLSQAIGTTIIVSPLDMAGQPGACMVTAVFYKRVLPIVGTTAHGEARSRDSAQCRDSLRSRRGGLPQWTNVWPISPAYGVCAGSVWRSPTIIFLLAGLLSVH